MPSLAIRDDSFPYIVGADSTQALEWNYGSMYVKQITAEAIHISKHNIQWFVLGKITAMRGWNHFICEPVQHALCQVNEVNGNLSSTNLTTNMLLFSSNKVDIPYDISKVRLPESFLKKSKTSTSAGSDIIDIMTCSTTTSNRELNYVDVQYDVSLCDLIDFDVEFVLCPDKNLMYWRYNTKSIVMMILITLVCLYFFTQVCQQLIKLLHGKRASFSYGTTILPIVIVIYYAVQHASNDTHLILEEEVMLQIVLLLYAGISTVKYTVLFGKSIFLHLQQLTNLNQAKTKNPDELKGLLPHKSLQHRQLYTLEEEKVSKDPLCEEVTDLSEYDFTAVGTLLVLQFVLTANMHNSYDNPFYDILCFLFGMRSFFKFLNVIAIHIPHYRCALWKILHTLLDTFVFCSQLYLGLRIKSESEEIYTARLSTIILFSVLGGTILHTIAKNTNTDNKFE